jgi:hypothetical protein
MNKKEARSILGVPKEASKNEIERKYAILLKKYRQGVYLNRQEEQDHPDEGTDIHDTGPADNESAAGYNAADPGYDFDLVTEAYNTLMGYEVKVEEEAPGMLASFLKKFNLDEKKTDNFLHYYKYHILAGILTIIFIAIIISSFVNRPDYDFSIAFLGRIFYLDSVDALQNRIKEDIPIIKEPGIDGSYLADDGTGEQQYAMEMKAMTLLYAGEVDVFILDRPTYERYAKAGAFMSLDEIAPRLGVDVSAHQDLVLAVEKDEELPGSGEEDSPAQGELAGESPAADTPGSEGTDTAGTGGSGPSGEKHLYGIYVTDSGVLRETGVFAEDMIAAIFAGCQQQDKAETFLKLLLK